VKDALRRAQPGVPGGQQDLATAQLHAMLAVADELRNIRNELMQRRGILANPNL
jgi:hypothetical protein